jgi:hypothetical protein
VREALTAVWDSGLRGEPACCSAFLRDASCLQHHISANQVSHELTGRERCGIDKLSFRI